MAKHLALVVAMLFIPALARADSIWTYQGNSTSGQPQLAFPPDTCGCALSGSVLLDTSLNVLSYSFTDGAVTLNQSNSTIVLAPMGNQLGLFGEWWLNITGGGTFLFSEFNGSADEATDSGTGGLDVVGNRGTWTEVVSTPEPGSLLLLGAGLAALALAIHARGNRWTLLPGK
jgi:PEP-CTERM motif